MMSNERIAKLRQMVRTREKCYYTKVIAELLEEVVRVRDERDALVNKLDLLFRRDWASSPNDSTGGLRDG